MLRQDFLLLWKIFASPAQSYNNNPIIIVNDTLPAYYVLTHPTVLFLVEESGLLDARGTGRHSEAPLLYKAWQVLTQPDTTKVPPVTGKVGGHCTSRPDNIYSNVRYNHD